VYDYARRIEVLREEMINTLTELRDKHSGKLTLGANENGALYVSDYITSFRQRYPRVKVEIRRSLSRCGTTSRRITLWVFKDQGGQRPVFNSIDATSPPLKSIG